jgi:ADP-ribose pyrophosphatase YjhB (NUDIX family)
VSPKAEGAYSWAFNTLTAPEKQTMASDPAESDHLPRPVAAVLAVVLRGEEFLLVRRANPPDQGLWGFPGGKIEPGEGVLQAALRELEEETGVHARAVKAFAALDSIDARPTHAGGHHYVLVGVLCHWRSGEAVAADDALEARWFDLPALLANKARASIDVDTLAQEALVLAKTSASGRVTP